MMSGKVARFAIAGAVIAVLGGGAWAAPSAPSNPTFAKDVAPIFYANCVGCHRPGDVTPMSLLTYEEARPWAKSIAQKVELRQMPPWHADPAHGKFKNDRSLSDAEIATIVAWVKQGAKPGNLAEMPPLPELPESEWRLGEPDAVLEFREIEVKAGDRDLFYDLEAATNFDEDKWLTAIEVLPGNRKVVHHVIIWQNSDGGGGPGWLGAWAAGMEPMVFPEGTGRVLKKGASLVGDMHYHPAETDEIDQTRIGLHFADADSIERELINLWIVNRDFNIPAGDANHQVKAQYTFAQDSQILGFLPHMHYRGKDFTYTAHYPDGTEETLMHVGRYDFNWQTVYQCAEPLEMPKGTRIECVAHYDNSEGNLANPDPNRNVTWGSESYDEMMIGFVDFVVKDGFRPESPEDVIARLVNELPERFPGEVYKTTISFDDEGFPGVMRLPKDGNDGEWHIAVMGMANKAKVYEVKWAGDEYTAKIDIPGQGTFTIKASLTEQGKAMTGMVTNGAFNLGLAGNRVD